MELTLDKIKNTVAYDKTSDIYKSFMCFIDCWYKNEISKGKTEQEALDITFKKLGEKIMSFSKH